LSQRGHAIEVRIYAEDPDDRFLPQSGRIALWREPSGPGIRVDGGVSTGTEVGVSFDPMLAKLVCYAADRNACIDRLDRALREFVILGINTNVSWLRRVVTHPAFREGKVSTRFLSDHEADLARVVPEEVPQIAALLAASGTGPSKSQGVPSVWDAIKVLSP
jgi:acetyl/propionyl-CoA carboxylase alpha subunit